MSDDITRHYEAIEAAGLEPADLLPFDPPEDLPRQKRRRRQTTCTCRAYPFPHRLGGGDCTRETRRPDLTGLEGWAVGVRRRMDFRPWMED